MKCPDCGTWAVIDSTNFGPAARVCTRCNRVWRIDPSDLRASATRQESKLVVRPERLRDRLIAWWTRSGTGRGEK